MLCKATGKPAATVSIDDFYLTNKASTNHIAYQRTMNHACPFVCAPCFTVEHGLLLAQLPCMLGAATCMQTCSKASMQA